MRLLFPIIFLTVLPAIHCYDTAKNEHPIETQQDLAYLEDFTFDFLKDGVYGDGSANEVTAVVDRRQHYYQLTESHFIF